MQFLSPNDLKWRDASVLLSNPLTKVRIFDSLDFSQLVSVVVSSSHRSFETGAEISSNQRSGSIAACGDAEPLLLFAVASGLIGLRYVRL